MSNVQCFTFSNGIQIPSIGYGTWRVSVKIYSIELSVGQFQWINNTPKQQTMFSKNGMNHKYLPLVMLWYICNSNTRFNIQFVVWEVLEHRDQFYFSWCDVTVRPIEYFSFDADDRWSPGRLFLFALSLDSTWKYSTTHTHSHHIFCGSLSPFPLQKKNQSRLPTKKLNVHWTWHLKRAIGTFEFDMQLFCSTFN